MKPITWKLIAGDFIILLLFILLPGIRGYSSWNVFEYLLMGIILVYIFYTRHHKKKTINQV